MKTQWMFSMATASVLASTLALAQSGPEVKDVAIKVNLKDSSLSSTSGKAGASMLTRGVYGDVGGAQTEVANVEACSKAKISNVSVDIKMERTQVNSTGNTRIGNVKAGCP